jgi:hypothetical protein
MQHAVGIDQIDVGLHADLKQLRFRADAIRGKYASGGLLR